jgi:phospholipase C
LPPTENLVSRNWQNLTAKKGKFLLQIRGEIMRFDRRGFFRRFAAASGGALLGGASGWAKAQRDNQPDFASELLPSPGTSGIQHIVVVTMENRSFDHFLGWLPNANAQQSFAYPNPSGGTTDTLHWPDYQGCGHPVPDNTYLGGREEYHDGSMDGWLLDQNNDVFAIGYYNEPDLPFLSALARNYTTLDNYFCSILARTFPNRLFMLAGQTDRLDDSLTLTALPTIFDRLFFAGVKARYYYSNVPFLALWGLKYFLITRTYDQFLFDAATGHLPAVSIVDPRFTIIDDDTGNDDHPHSNIQRGEAFLATTFQAVASSPKWSSTVFIVTFDEWGGFFDHVAPTRVVAPNNVDRDMVDGKVLLGFRVPTIVASPWTRNVNPDSPAVKSTLFDHTSILKLIEWRWGLKPLTARDASSDIGNLASVLNFANKNTGVPKLPQPPLPPSSPCSLLTPLAPTAQQSQATVWSDLLNSARRQGWKLDQH